MAVFRPTERNLELAFAGVDDMENGRALMIANGLVSKGILFKKPGKVETFAAMALGGDFAEIEQLKKSIGATVKTAELVVSADLTTTRTSKYFLRLLAEIANSREKISVSALAERAGQFLLNNPAAFHDLKIFLTAQRGREIFTDFLKTFEGGIIFDFGSQGEPSCRDVWPRK